VPSVVVVCAASLNARAGASNSTALAESGHVQQGSSSHVSGGSAPHALPGVPDVELKQAHVVFRYACVFTGTTGRYPVTRVYPRRHGARAPLSTKHGSGDADWSVCSGKANLLAVKVHALDGGPQMQSAADARQRAGALPGGCHLGQLSDLGVQQAIDLGTTLRARYIPALLPPSASPRPPLLAVRSSNLQRTVATASGVLTGMFPHAVGSSATRPAEIRVAHDDVEWLFPNTDACPRLKNLWAAYSGAWDTPAGKAAWKATWAKQLDELGGVLTDPEHREALGRAWGIVELLDHTTSRQAHGLPALGNMTPSNVDDVRAIAAHLVSHMFTGGHMQAAEPPTSTPAAGVVPGEGLKLAVGRLLADMTSSMEAAASHRSPLRVALYAAHDTTVLPLLLALRSSESPRSSSSRSGSVESGLTWPPYASWLALELWAPTRETAHAEPHAIGVDAAEQGSTNKAPVQPLEHQAVQQQHYVRAIYNGAVVPLPCARGQPHGACPLAEFTSSMRALLPKDFHAECTIPRPKHSASV